MGGGVEAGVEAGAGAAVRAGTTGAVAAGVSTGSGGAVSDGSAFTPAAPIFAVSSLRNAARVSGSRFAFHHTPNRPSTSVKRARVPAASSLRPAAVCSRAKRTSPSTRSGGSSRKPKQAICRSSTASRCRPSRASSRPARRRAP